MTVTAHSPWTGRRYRSPGPGRPGGTSGPVATIADRWATRGSRAVAGGAIAISVVVPGGWGHLAWLPLVVGLALGLPHGAADHLLPAQRQGNSPRLIATVALGYGALAVLAYLGFRAAPLCGLGLFIALSVWHFGAGETAFDDERSGRRVTPAPVQAFLIGALVLLVPLVRGAVAGPDRSGVRAVTAAVVDRQVPGIPSGWVSVVVATALTTAAILIVLAWRRGQRARSLDLVLLAGLVSLTPPPVAFGVFFGCWHALRHTARLVSGDPRNSVDLAAGRLARPVRRFLAATALPTAIVVGAVLLLGRVTSSWIVLTAAVLPVLAALTVPHTAVVTWLDHQPRSPTT